jgi:hypothetical protein
MSASLTFNTVDTSVAVSELEDLRKRGEFQALFDRCFKEDLNVAQFVRGLQCLYHSWFSPTSHMALWRKLDPLLKLFKQPSHSFLFNASFFPGNGISESACSSDDGQTFAYLTYSAVGIHEIGKRKALSKEEYQRALSKGPDEDLPSVINIIRFQPYEARSISIDLEEGLKWEARPSLVGVDANYVYVVSARTNNTKELYVLPIDGTGKGRLCMQFTCPAACYRVNLMGSRLWFIDQETKDLVEASLDGTRISSSLLQLPDGLDFDQLHELVISKDGRYALITVNNRTEESRYVFGLAQRSLPGNALESPLVSIQWFRRKDLRDATFFTSCTYGPAFDVIGDLTEEGAFYCLDISGQLYSIDLRAMHESTQQLEALNDLEILRSFQRTNTENKSPFAVMARARTRPLVATYCMKTDSIQVWDSARRSRLLELACPYHIDEMFFIQEDRILVTISRSMGKTCGTVAVTFLDYALLLGKSPVLFSAADYVRLTPLLSLAPDDIELRILDCLIRYFATQALTETTSPSSAPKESIWV